MEIIEKVRILTVLVTNRYNYTKIAHGIVAIMHNCHIGDSLDTNDNFMMLEE